MIICLGVKHYLVSGHEISRLQHGLQLIMACYTRTINCRPCCNLYVHDHSPDGDWHPSILLCKLLPVTRETKLTLSIALNPKSKLTLECGTNPTNHNTRACFKYTLQTPTTRRDASYKQGDHSSWKVMEFNKTIFKAWKVMENDDDVLDFFAKMHSNFCFCKYHPVCSFTGFT